MLSACGITEFFLPVNDVATARIKVEPEDFLVVEVDPNGCRTDAVDYEFPKPPARAAHSAPSTDMVVEDTTEDFVMIDSPEALTDEVQDALQKTFLSKADAIDADLCDNRAEYYVGLFNTRARRERLHRSLKIMFPHLRSDTRRLASDDGWAYHVYITYDRDYLLIARLIGEASADTISAWCNTSDDNRNDSDSMRFTPKKCSGGAEVTASFPADVPKSTRRAFHEAMARRYPSVTCRVSSGVVTLRYAPRPRLKRPRSDGAAAVGFTHMLVRKRNVDALELRERIAECCGVAETSVCAAGLKDKRAVTYQRCSVPGDWRGAECPRRCPAPGGMGGVGGVGGGAVEILRAAGPFPAPVAVGDLRGNYFRVRLVAVRGTTPDALCRRAARVFSGGFLNYFGQQRFGGDAARAADRVGVHALAGRWADALRCAVACAPGLHDALPQRAEPRDAPQTARDAQCVLRGLRRCLQRIDAVEPMASAVEPMALAVEPMASAVEPMASAVEPMASAVGPMASAVGPMASAVGPMASAVEPMASAVKPMASAVEPMASAVGPMASAVEPMASAVEPMASAVKPMASAVEPMASAVGPMASGASGAEGEGPLTRDDVTRATPRWQRVCRDALEAVPYAIRVLWMHAAQSLVFNLMLSRLHAAGVELDGLALPIVGYSIDVPLALRGVLDETLAELQLTQEDVMGQKKVMGVPLPGAMRQAVVRPAECSVQVEESRESEVKDGFVVTLEFQLPSSSYATVLLREVLGSDEWLVSG